MNSYPDVIIDFMEYLETIKGRSPNTIKEYGYDVNLLTKYLKARKDKIKIESFEDLKNNIDISKVDSGFYEDVDLVDLHSFMSFLDRTQNDSNITRARKTSSIKTFFKYLINIRKLDIKNPAEELETPKKNSRQPVYLTLEECEKLLDTILEEESDFLRSRDYCIVTLFLNCGMRLSELSNIDIPHIKEDTLTVIGKGDKERTIYLNEACLASIADYLMYRPKIDSPALFVSKKKNRMSNRAIQYRIDHYLELAGFDTSIYSVHKLRHTSATLMYQYGGVDIKVLQEILGHESVATTQIYTHINNKSLKKAVDSNPLNKIKKRT
ncbi:MAG: tyrosine recombinase XerC [Finegoldia sp.]|nr:tyrosine recombinase XerC [Finegoldia sp.]